MKLSTALIASVAAIDVKTLVNQNDDDRKVPHRHPLQRLWRLYQFSEEIIQVRILLLKNPKNIILIIRLTSTNLV